MKWLQAGHIVEKHIVWTERALNLIPEFGTRRTDDLFTSNVLLTLICIKNMIAKIIDQDILKNIYKNWEISPSFSPRFFPDN